MENQLNNGFCPKCGALLRNNVCPSCGFGEAVSDEMFSQEAIEMPEQKAVDLSQNGNVDMEEQPAVEATAQSARPYENYMNQMSANTYHPDAAYNNGQNDYNPYGQNYSEQNPNMQNAYGQNPYMNNGMQQGNYYANPAQPPQKKSNKGVIAVVIILILLLFVVVGIAVFFMGKLLNEAAEKGHNDDYGYDYDYEDEFDEDDDYDYDDEDDYGFEDDDDDYSGSYDESLLAFTEDIDWDDDDWDEEPYNYDAKDVEGDIYYDICNCIDENVDYQLVHESYEDLDEDLNVCMRVNYYQIEGDIPNLDEINEAIKAQAMWAVDNYYEDPEFFEEEFEEYGSGYVVEADTYITYNDDEMVSVVSEVYYESATVLDKVIYSTNIDLINGEVIWNTDVFEFSDEFIADFREICEDQNGTIDSIENFTDDELREFFEDEYTFIYYHTPCGIELGINYTTDDGYYGWATATYQDYQQYMKSY